MDDITIKALQEFGLLIKGVSKTIKNDVKERKGGFLSMVLGILGASLLENLLTGKGVRGGKIPERGAMRAGVGTIKAGQNF